MCDGSGATSWSHDKMGRVLSENRTIGTHTNTTAYAYNLDGSISTLTYPNTGKIITYSPNSSGGFTAGRPISAKDVAGGFNYVTSAKYAPQGALASLTNGSSIFEAFSYNSRLQPLQVFYGTNTPPSLTGSTCPSNFGNIMHRVYNFGLGSNDNGNVMSIANCRDTNRRQNFDYDAVNRIAHGYTSGTNWGETYTIDPWSNLTNIAGYPNKTNHETLNCANANTKNQLNTCYTYDASGNLMQNGSTTYTYDAENRLTALSTPAWYYVYDGDGSRVEKCTSSSCPSTGTGTVYWRNLGGDPISESGLNGTVNHEYIFFNGKRAARRDITGNVVSYYFSDHLGSTDVVTTVAGTITKESDYYPYGGEIPISGSDINNYKFTGKERDTESGLDEFGARYYGSSLGRFMTPDWAATATAVPYANFGNPQSLNLYSYVKNNPTTFGDPDGHCPQCVEEVLEYLSESPAGAAVENWGAQALAGAGVLLTTAATALSNGNYTTPGPYVGPLDQRIFNQNTSAQSGGQNAQQTPSAQPSQSTPAQPEPPSGNDLNRSSSTKQTGAQGQNTETTVKEASGSTTYKTTPGKTGGQSTMVVRKDANGNTVYVKQEARTNNKDFTKPPDHVHYKKPIDKEVQ